MTERQKLDTIWPLAIVTIMLVLNWVNYFIFHYPELNLFYYTMLGAILAAVFLVVLRLTITIDAQFITLSYFPLQFKKTIISTKDIIGAEKTDISILKDSKGYGIKRHNQYGTMYLINGGKAITVVLKDSRIFTIGTQKQDQLLAAIEKVTRLNK